MIHASVNALRCIYSWCDADYNGGWDLASRKACDWTTLHLTAELTFVQSDASNLMNGYKPRIEITCPQCAVLLDAALELRGKCS